MGDALAVEEQRSILSGTHSLVPEPDTINKIVKRIRLLVTKLLPVQVDLESISDATSSIITPEVIAAFAKCGGDFAEAVPFCLLRAKATFIREGYINGPDYDECLCRATACEVLARRIIHNLPPDRLENVMSTRFKYRERDGDESPPTSALETAIDQHCTIFLSSSEAQHVINLLWRGDWVQQNNDDGDIDYVQYEPKESASFWDHVNPNRISVPRYQTTFKIAVWFIYLFVYSQTVQSPLDQLDPARRVDEWEYVLYIMTLSFLVEEAVKTFKTIRLAAKPLAAIGFWTVVSFLTDALLLAAFSLRVAGLRIGSDNLDQAQMLRLRSFQVLSCVAPLIWLRLLTVFDGFKIVGVLQLVVFRMLRESAIFFILLAIIGIGFLQSMYALDAADGESGGTIVVVNSLVQALLGSPDFDSPNDRFGYPFGLIVYYTWNLLTTVILLNVLIALFGSAYADIEENATDEYLAFFAHRTVSLIRAPDSFVYPAPFNLLEGFLIAPLEYVLPKKAYTQLNRVVMTVVFFIPLTIIALFETRFSRSHAPGGWTDYFDQPMPEDEEDPKVKDPSGDEGGEICTEKFDDLVKSFPNTAITETAVVDRELRAVRKKMEELEELLKALAHNNGKEGNLVDVTVKDEDEGKREGKKEGK